MAEHDDETPAPAEAETPVLRMVGDGGLACSGDVCELPVPASVDVE
jgi:hypothetical protein